MTDKLALQAVLEIGDRSAVGYEVLPRCPRGRPFGVADFACALGFVSHVSPAVLILPGDEEFFAEMGDGIVDQIAAAGVMRSEVVWLFPPCSHAGKRAQFERRSWLNESGFPVAVDGVTVASLAETELFEVAPAFAVLDASLTNRVTREARARAEVGAMLSYFGRLGTRMVVRGVDDERFAHLLLEAGLQLGVGRALHAPVTLDKEAAEPGDEVVTRSWFRERAVKVLERPEGDIAPIFYESLPPDTGSVQDDRDFARVLAEAARLLQAEHDTASILDAVAELLPRVVPVDRLAIFQADWDSYTLRPRVVVGDTLQGLSAADDLMETGITGWAFLRGDPYNCGDTYRHPEAVHVPGSIGGQFDESLVVIPLISGDYRLGAIDLWRDGLDQFTEADVERCVLVGYLAAAAWRNSQLYGELERRAITDKLTGLLNKRWWDELAQREAAQAMRAGSTVALLLVDIDNFKRVNDSGGHGLGDVTLRNAARVLATAVRSGDAAVRFGGDEFLLVMHNADVHGAERVAEAVRKALAELPPVPGVGAITASIGVALYPDHGETLDEVLHASDLAMYTAKAKGRDQVVVCSTASPVSPR